MINLFYFSTIKPIGLVPFNILQKQERRQGVPNEDRVSFIRYIEINVYGQRFRLLKKTNTAFSFDLNGYTNNPPYIDKNGVNIILYGGRMFFSTIFGLTILWNGNDGVEVHLCDVYRSKICGLCGNADGRPVKLKSYYKKDKIILSKA